MFTGVIHGFNSRHSTISILSTMVGSTVLALAAYTWWKKRSEAEEDDEMFEIKNSVLFDPNVKFPEKSAMDPLSYTPGVLDTGVVSTEERDDALNLARKLLRQLHDPRYDVEEKAEAEAEAGSDSEETNVSLNYHIATELEKEARDGLVEAVVQSEVLKLEGQGKMLKPENCVDVLHRAVEYLDISNEREKLRQRRAAMHLNGSHEQRFPWGGNGNDMERLMEQRKAIDAAYAESFAHGVEIDHRLREANNNNYGMEERFEMNWEGDDDNDDDDAEADLMAYLDEDDRAGYGSMMDARMAAMLGMDMRLLGADGVVYDGDGDYNDDVEEEEEYEEDEIDEATEKAAFERMLLDKLYQLAEGMGKNGITMNTTRNSGKNPQKLTTTLEENNMSENGVEELQGDNDNDDDEWETESDDDNVVAEGE
ncbi:uncharacterized protein TM35_000091910 [Trypanosoma theileri]|uniref:Present in the outer mitochondrial membrane proteome 25 n=1 Tax=Trypanosoma theileri TaxID=67003 RepID=A0A1X0NZW4_9TRYP|nr:uncharacterized protein TM35_000091910 [Trypanosoma theileri]ORC90141.1 hypothetical protein TM35_000091910 [Trypanosoma theileri]